VKVPKARTEIPVSSISGLVELINQYGVILFDELQHKQKFFQRYNGDSIIIIECGVPTIKSIAPFSGYIVTCRSPDELMDILRGIPNDQDEEISKRHLNTLVVENISAFYWNLATLSSQEKFSWYKGLNNELAQIRKRYGCNVLVTGWDIDFDRGFNARRVIEKAPVALQDLTYLPGELFLGATRIIHYGETTLHFRDKKWRAIDE